MNIAGLMAGLKASTARPGEAGFTADPSTAFADLLALTDIGTAAATDRSGAGGGLPLAIPAAAPTAGDGGSLVSTTAIALIDSIVPAEETSDDSADTTGPVGPVPVDLPRATSATATAAQSAVSVSDTPLPTTAPAAASLPPALSSVTGTATPRAGRSGERQESESIPAVEGTGLPATTGTATLPVGGTDTVAPRLPTESGAPLWPNAPERPAGTKRAAPLSAAAKPSAADAAPPRPTIAPASAPYGASAQSTQATTAAPTAAAAAARTPQAEPSLQAGTVPASASARASTVARPEAVMSSAAARSGERSPGAPVAAPTDGELASRSAQPGVPAPAAIDTTAAASAGAASTDSRPLPAVDGRVVTASQPASAASTNTQSPATIVPPGATAVDTAGDGQPGIVSAASQASPDAGGAPTTRPEPHVAAYRATVSSATVAVPALPAPQALSEDGAADDAESSPPTAAAGADAASTAAKPMDTAAKPTAPTIPSQPASGREPLSSATEPAVDAPARDAGLAAVSADETAPDTGESSPDDSAPSPTAAPPAINRGGVSAAALTFAAMLRDDAPGQDPTRSDPASAPEGLRTDVTQGDRAAARQVALQSPPPHHAAPIVAQAAIAIARHVQQGTNRFQIRLDPPELGRVDVEMKFDADGNVKAHLTVERRETLDLFLRDQRGLERALDAAGVKVDSGSLQFSMKEQGGGFGAFADGRGSQPGRHDAPGAGSAAPQDSNTTSAELAGGPSLAGRSAGVLDIRI